jgi:hypothetical protein
LRKHWNHQLSEVAFDHLVEVSAPTPDLINYLRNEWLNLSLDRNFSAFIQYYKTNHFNKKQHASFMELIKNPPISPEFYNEAVKLLASSILDHIRVSNTNNLHATYLVQFSQIWEAFSPQMSRSRRFELDKVFLTQSIHDLCILNELKPPCLPDAGEAIDNFPDYFYIQILDLIENTGYWRSVLRNDTCSPRTNLPVISGYGNVLLDILVILPKDIMTICVPRITFALATKKSYEDFQVLSQIWFDVLRISNVAAKKSTQFGNYIDLAEHFSIISDHLEPGWLWRQFEIVGPKESANLLLRHWFSKSIAEEIRTTASSKSPAENVQALHLCLTGDTVYESSVNPFVSLCITLWDSTHFRRFYKDIVTVIYCAWGSDSLFEFLQQTSSMWKHQAYQKIPMVQPWASILKTLAVTAPTKAAEIVPLVPFIDINYAHDLPFGLIDERNLTLNDIRGLLDRDYKRNKVPSHLREQPHNPLSRKRINNIQNLACAIARDGSRSSREGYYIVSMLYRYLNSRQVPHDKELTRSLVFAGIIRPLLHHEWVPMGRYNYILAIVRKTEGDKVADNLRNMIWFWRGKVIDDAVAAWRNKRLPGRASVSAAKKMGLI